MKTVNKQQLVILMLLVIPTMLMIVTAIPITQARHAGHQQRTLIY